MIQAQQVIFLVILTTAIVEADVLKLGSNSYPVNSQSCPLGQLYDYSRNQSFTIIELVNQLNNTLISNSSHSNIIHILTEIQSHLNNMTDLYYSNQAGSKIQPNLFILVLLGLFWFSRNNLCKQHHIFLFLIVFILILSPMPISAEGDGGGGHGGGDDGGGGHGDDGDDGDDDGDGESVGDGIEGFSGSPGEYVDANGNAISSVSPKTGLLIRGVYIQGKYSPIEQGCLVQTSSDFIQQNVNLAQNATLALLQSNGTAMDLQLLLTIKEAMQNITTMFNAVNDGFHLTANKSIIFVLLLLAINLLVTPI